MLLNRTHSWRHEAGAVLLALLSICCFHFFFQNRFFAITEGWFSIYAIQLKQGLVLYKDFPYVMPPLYPLILQWFTDYFGPEIIKLRLLGSAVLIAMYLCIYFTLRFFFSALPAAIATCFISYYYELSTITIGYDFHHWVNLFGILGVLFGLHGISSAQQHKKFAILQMFAAGMFLALAVLIKQSVGIAISIFVGPALAVSLRCIWPQRWLRSWIALGLGFVIPITLTLLWLQLNHNLDNFLVATGKEAIGLKGGFASVMLDWLAPLMTPQFWGDILLMSFWLAAILLVIHVWKIAHMRLTNGLPPHLNQPKSGLTLALGFFALATTLPILGYFSFIPHMGDWLYIRFASYYNTLGWISLFFCTLILAISYRRGANKVTLSNLFIFIGLCCGIMLGRGMSGSLYDYAYFMSFAYLVAYLVEKSRKSWLILLAILTIMLILMSAMIEKKYQVPYYWWFSSSDIRESRCNTHQLNVLGGICLTNQVQSSLEQLVERVQTNVKPNEAVYVFPSMPILHLLVERPIYMNIAVSWHDFLSPSWSQKIVDNLQKNPPRAIIFGVYPDSAKEENSGKYNSGNNTGTMLIERKIEELVTNGTYTQWPESWGISGLPIKLFLLNIETYEPLE